MAIYAVIAYIIDIFLADHISSLFNRFIFSVISHCSAVFMLSMWDKKQSIYNYRFGQDNESLDHDTELSS